MDAPKTELEIEEFKRHKQQEREKYLVGVVDPGGIIRHCIAPPGQDGSDGPRQGIDVVAWINGEQQITQYGKREGWTFLEQRCIEDGVPELYQNWRTIALARMRGHRVKMPDGENGESDMTSVYPPSVLRQREEDGRATMTAMVWDPKTGSLRAASEVEIDKEARKERVGRLAGEMGLKPKKEK